MKQLYFLLLFSVFSLSAQDFSYVDNKVKIYPKLITAEKLASKIAIDFNSDEEKARAVFSWLSFNISYNLKEFYNPRQKRIGFRYKNETEKQEKLKAIKNAFVTKTFINRSALCEGYAQAFSKTCTLLNIKNKVIKGYVRNSSYDIDKVKKRANHAWNAVNINNKWIYIDATWAAGAVTNGRWQRNFNDYYFNIPKEKYFYTHFPEDSLWRLRVKKMSLATYFKQPIYTSSFLKKQYHLVKPNTGIIHRKANTPIVFTIKNVKPNQAIYCGFRGVKYAKKAKTTFKGNTVLISITPPSNSKELYLIIDKDVVLEFLIK
ncbi:transglutaminase domain-containing protein [Tenacibaculum ovolyticum]|uniref:transglutaminase domain-containing protein n=1 Tax=Tenacibaculum ovolyticum TaxID=104270 RepID=UPI001F34E029|nr:transglutaminase domain-containing protein [Tenacibaculum ovolyticum]